MHVRSLFGATLALAVILIPGARPAAAQCAPVEVGSNNAVGAGFGVALSGSLAYLASGGGNGLEILDVSNPASPTVLGSYNTVGTGSHVAVDGSVAYVADGALGLQILDVSDPTTPVLLSTYDTPGFAQGVAVSGSVAFVADNSAGLRIIDVSDPVNPAFLGSFSTNSAIRVAVSGTVAYVASTTDSLKILDVSTPASPTLLSTVSGGHRAVAVADGVLYAAWQSSYPNSRLDTIDVSDPMSPTVLSQVTLPTNGYPNGVAVADGLAYVAHAQNVLQIVDVSDPGSAVFLTSWTASFTNGQGVAASGSLVYLAGLYTDLRIIDMASCQPAAEDEVTPDVIYGSGNDNGEFTIDRQGSVELGMRGKLRYPASNVFNGNGDGTYTFSTGTGGGPAGNSEWSFDFAVNADYDDATGDTVGDYVYRIGMDNDPSGGTDFLVFDPITIGTIIPYTTPAGPIPYWDHSMGDNSTPNGGGVEAGDGPTYAGYLSSLNVAQQSWKPTFYQNEAPYSWDPDVPGRYDYYLAAYDGVTEVARTAITIIAADGATMSLEADPCQGDQDGGKAGLQIAVELRLRNPDGEEVTGYQAFLAYDASAMTYEGACSSYDSTIFASHIQPIASADVATNELRLDGNTGSSTGTTDDALLATLIFTVAECDPNAVTFDLAQPFASELSYDGSPVLTDLMDGPAVVIDTTPPSITCPADITVSADASLGDGCQGAFVTWADPVVSDTCTAVTVICDPPSGSEFAAGTTTPVTCVATDACGNESSCMFNVTVTETNTVCVDVQLVGVTTAPTRCIRFVTDDCGATADVALTFDGIGLFSGEIEVPCGIWTSLCAKDEQHTQWANGSLVLNGTKYELSGGPLELKAGDTDNDGDVDINDVTLFLAQQGGPEPAGTCPWDGSRGADFSNNGNVAAEDFSLMTPQWLTTSSCSCTSMLAGDFGDDNVGDRRTSVLVSELDPWTAAQADLNRDRVIDYRDVEIFEQRNGLAKTLSAAMKRNCLSAP